ncbi:zinc ribbon domain-containing protein [Actinoallomurus rhizosphaericola]|uniref:zinc ribbon domain-containing protein n=1 Tax=Actinoallomurus rhizosphaericola TaxID=2952536 RepID=UPI00209371CB|nr:hypothetical protein [Actinoallomurus rhizosphaericola]MCO5997849.1 hypothetical protein [Actinoallomurus rhizosphaericola]
MDCPACGSEVPPGRSACPRCGTLLPSAGEHPGPGPHSPMGMPGDSPTAPPNPRTEPLPSIWDASEDRPWTAPPDPRPAAGAEDGPADPGNATQILGPPAGGPMAPDLPSAGGPLAPDLPSAGGPIAPDLPPGGGPMAADPPPAGWSPGPPVGGPPPSQPSPAPWNTPETEPAPYLGPPVGPPAGQPFGGPGYGAAPPGYHPNGWDQGVLPAAGQPGESPDTGGKRNNRMILLVGGIAAAVVVVGGLAYALTQGSSGGGGGTPTSQKTTADTAAQQASAVDQVLKTGQTARGHLPARLRTCDDVSAGVAGFQRVVRDRQQELSRTKALSVDRLPNGSRLRQAMITAYQNSLEADQAYLAWAKKVRARGCGGRIAPLTAPYQDAIAANDKAGPAKRRVVALWKPIASAHGLPTYVWNRL